jgi:hypothetical protein
MSTWTGTVNTDWNNAGNWTSGGIGAGIPNAGVDAIFDGTAVRDCVLGGPRACRALTFTGFAYQVDLATFTLTTNNNITFQANQSSRIDGTTGRLLLAANSTITSNSGVWPLDILFQNFTGATFTLADDLRVAGSYLGSGGGTQIFTGPGNLYIGGDVTVTGSRYGNSNLIMNGSGTYTGSAVSNLEIDTTGSIIITGGVRFTRKFIITAVGTITMAAANVIIENAATVDLGGRIIGNLTHSISVGGSPTIAYLTNVVCNNFTIGNSSSVIYNGPGRVLVYGNYNLGNSGASTSTLVVELKGAGTISSGIMALSCVVNSSGTYTLGSPITLQSSISFTCTTSTLNTGTGTVIINNGVTIVPSTVNWYNITIPTNATITIN